jgi:AcrR family transcriptional regulator
MMAETTHTPRAYKSTIREKQAQQTRELILDSLVSLLEERPAYEISTRQLAQHSGIALRTVYRHFPDRHALLNGLGDRLATVMDTRRPEGELRSIDDLGAMIRQFHRANDESAALVRAEVLFNNDPAQPARESANRSELTTRLIAEAFPNLDPIDRHCLVGLIRTIASGHTWLQLRDGFGLTGEQSGPLVEWALNALIAAIRHGHQPQIAELGTGHVAPSEPTRGVGSV